MQGFVKRVKPEWHEFRIARTVARMSLGNLRVSSLQIKGLEPAFCETSTRPIAGEP